LKSLHSLLLAVWLYYAISVPFDLVCGFGITTSPNMPDLSSDRMQVYVLLIFLHYLLFGASYYFTYKLIPGRIHATPCWVAYKIYVPPLWFVLLVNVSVFALNIYFFGDMLRNERVIANRESLSLFFLSAVVYLVMALNIIYIHGVNDRRKALWVMLFAILFIVASGGRTALVAFVVIYIVRYQIAFSRRSALTLCVAFVLFAVLWKRAWGQALYFLNSGILGAFLAPEYVGLLSFEGGGPYELSTALMLHHGESPLLLGYTYLVKPLQMLLPRFLHTFPMQTLAEYYGVIFRPEAVIKGGGIGFSAMGEAWLNFTHFGPIILGFVVAVISKYFDSKPRGLLYYIMLIVFLRFFRADAASLFKSFFVIQGGALIIVFIALKLVWELRKTVAMGNRCRVAI